MECFSREILYIKVHYEAQAIPPLRGAGPPRHHQIQESRRARHYCAKRGSPAQGLRYMFMAFVPGEGESSYLLTIIRHLLNNT
ncbi:MAG TPA: hypothetical protein VKM55_19310 [Candidatus Lokiarchaeia archaeon]|nr:hypothetical protein [Candidatus Lokiarchaeia archaeon]